jgi:hypothetical protein
VLCGSSYIFIRFRLIHMFLLFSFLFSWYFPFVLLLSLLRIHVTAWTSPFLYITYVRTFPFFLYMSSFEIFLFHFILHLLILLTQMMLNLFLNFVVKSLDVVPYYLCCRFVFGVEKNNSHSLCESIWSFYCYRMLSM